MLVSPHNLQRIFFFFFFFKLSQGRAHVGQPTWFLEFSISVKSLC